MAPSYKKSSAARKGFQHSRLEASLEEGADRVQRGVVACRSGAVLWCFHAETELSIGTALEGI